MAEVWQADLLCEPETETDEFGRRSSLLLKLEDLKLYSPEFERFFDKGEEYASHPSMGDVRCAFVCFLIYLCFTLGHLLLDCFAICRFGAQPSHSFIQIGAKVERMHFSAVQTSLS